LKSIVIQYKHANFDECIKIGHHLLSSRRQGFNAIERFNTFKFTDYQRTRNSEKILKDISLGSKESDFDRADFDPLYCGLVVALILVCEKEGHGLSKILFEKQDQAFAQYKQR
jgi:hypothetical protein